jgi:hypothetical protein
MHAVDRIVFTLAAHNSPLLASLLAGKDGEEIRGVRNNGFRVEYQVSGRFRWLVRNYTRACARWWHFTIQGDLILTYKCV